ncbi:uncharacterized protein MYCFIDRAFT_83568 [Pseudocercospora fijiensis CIRAD86]|uniref:Uncharacterized protein n=1 Tax=Pseudocercospora fijiensis (strain CIRAD86) TaxID=383855 RepID=M3AXJ1_PSEFD|nr:uncharacterized protein MYCFIDRAFT_83568 [Pseudocercospora fijiensis CIRAD86]EME82182.1 hypothetical protein MYCFIDRAFT_83568 [Pseudocercospora fijiensis CIRAD86]
MACPMPSSKPRNPKVEGEAHGLKTMRVLKDPSEIETLLAAVTQAAAAVSSTPAREMSLASAKQEQKVGRGSQQIALSRSVQVLACNEKGKGGSQTGGQRCW